MTFFDDSATLTFPGEPFDPFAMDLDVSKLDGFLLPDFMFATAPTPATPGSSARITELPDDFGMTPEMEMEIQPESLNMAENITIIQTQAPVDATQQRPKKRPIDTPQNDQLQPQRRFVSFSKCLANEQNQRP
jgi:hypothetical protein